jgi:[ribosomal protein S18]-alanine N-acetyltransferase
MFYFRDGVVDDVAQMARIHAAAFADAWQLRELQRLVEHPASFSRIAVDDNVAIGFSLGMLAVDDGELLTLALEPGASGRGRGTAMMQDFLETLSRRNGARCFLEVSENNQAALHLYRRFHFVEGRRRPGYYRDGSDALTFSLLDLSAFVKGREDDTVTSPGLKAIQRARGRHV